MSSFPIPIASVPRLPLSATIPVWFRAPEFTPLESEDLPCLRLSPAIYHNLYALRIVDDLVLGREPNPEMCREIDELGIQHQLTESLGFCLSGVNYTLSEVYWRWGLSYFDPKARYGWAQFRYAQLGATSRLQTLVEKAGLKLNSGTILSAARHGHWQLVKILNVQTREIGCPILELAMAAAQGGHKRLIVRLQTFLPKEGLHQIAFGDAVLEGAISPLAKGAIQLEMLKWSIETLGAVKLAYALERAVHLECKAAVIYLLTGTGKSIETWVLKQQLVEAAAGGKMAIVKALVETGADNFAQARKAAGATGHNGIFGYLCRCDASWVKPVSSFQF